MKTFQNFDINDPIQVSILGRAYQLSVNARNIEVGINYLKERYGSAPFQAHEALFKKAMGYDVTPAQLQYIEAYINAEQKFIRKFNDLYDYPGRNDNYPDDFDPSLYGLD